jgi:hypothetical protein
MTGAALGWVFLWQFWRLWLREVVGTERERGHVDNSADVVDLAQWRREHPARGGHAA